MKKTQFIDYVRNIKKQFVSWLSIIIIATLAVIAFLGIRFAVGSLRKNINDFYAASNYRDLEILSILRFSKDDLKQIEDIEGVETVEGVYSYATTIKSSNNSLNATIMSLDDRINAPSLRQGKLPSGNNECLIEEIVANKLDLKVGDHIYTEENSYLKQNQFVISGICVHPDHIAKIMDNAGNGYVLVNDAVFNNDEDGFDDSYSSLLIRFESDEERDTFSDAYFDKTKTIQDKIEDISENRAKLRYDQIIKKAQDLIDENEEKLSNARSQLDEARATLDEKQKEVEDGERKLASSYRQLRDLKAKLDEAREKLDEAGGELGNAKDELDRAEGQLNSARKELSDGYQNFIQERKTLKEYLTMYLPNVEQKISWIEDDSFNVDSAQLSLKKYPLAQGEDAIFDHTIDEYFDNVGNWLKNLCENEIEKMTVDAGVVQLKNTIDLEDCRKWEESHDQYLAARAKFNQSYSAYNSGYESFIDGLHEYEDGMAEYDKGMAAYRSGVKALNDAKAQLQEKEAEYAQKEIEYQDAADELEEAKKRMADIPENRWIFFNVKGNASYVFAKGLANNFNGISITFSLLFVVIGALVIYATVGKTIDEQRTQVGTTKALGFFNSEIMNKYLVFGLTATIIGVTTGILLSYFVVLRSAIGTQTGYFHIGEMGSYFETGPVILVSVSSIVLTVAAVYLACNRLVRQPARILMQSSTPYILKKKNARNRPNESLYSKLILRNMVSDPKRVSVTIISIAGSCALILIGLTILHAVSSAVDLQFNHINQYDYQINYDSGVNEEVEQEIEKILDANKAEYIKVIIKNHSFMSDDELDSCRFLIGDLDEIKDYILMIDTKTKEPLNTDKEGIYVPIKMNENAHYTEIGTVTVFDEVMNSYEAKVADDYMLYAARIFIMSRETYADIYGKQPVNSQYLIRIDDERAESANKAILNLEGVSSILPSDNDKEDFDSFVALARAMVMLLTVMSFAMAYFILLNLINMFINQKKSELTIMRINGFTVKEVKRYVGMELIATTVAGIVIGLPLGAFMAYRIILLLENANCFDRSIYYPGWFVAAAVTAMFSLLISLSALRKVKDLKLTDI